jgi:cAMP phosphodiesterase
MSVSTWLVSHGCNAQGTYDSSAFFLKHDPSNREFLFFGDVEPDSISSAPRNLQVWRAAAPKLAANPPTLSAVFLECSWPSGRNDDTLYGHLTPEHLLAELVSLAKEVCSCRLQLKKAANGRAPARKRQRTLTSPPKLEDLTGTLTGLNVYIIHCKDDADGNPTRELILKQVTALVKKSRLGAKVHAAEQGTKISKYG